LIRFQKRTLHTGNEQKKFVDAPCVASKSEAIEGDQSCKVIDPPVLLEQRFPKEALFRYQKWNIRVVYGCRSS